MQRANVVLGLTGAFLFAANATRGQAPPKLEFEVASVKRHLVPLGDIHRPWSPNIDCGPITVQCGLFGNRFADELASLADLIMDAYRLRRYQIAGLPSWGDSGHDLYDVDARATGDHPTLDQARLMLQTLLAQRFQLKVHHETKELPVYAIVPARNGPKLKPTDKPCALPPPPGGGRRAKGASGGRGPDGNLGPLNLWVEIPAMVSQFTDRPVIDKTGLKEGEYYCTLDGLDPLFSVTIPMRGGGGARGGASPPSDGDPGGASIFTLVQEKWGLKLEAQKGPVDVLVIDHVERPSEN